MLFSVQSCLFQLCSGLCFIQHCGVAADHIPSDILAKHRVHSGECLREHLRGGPVPSCQMFVKNTQPVGESNVWMLRQMRSGYCCFCPEQTLLINASVIISGALNLGRFELWTMKCGDQSKPKPNQLSSFSCGSKNLDILVTSPLVTSAFSLFRFRVCPLM